MDEQTARRIEATKGDITDKDHHKQNGAKVLKEDIVVLKADKDQGKKSSSSQIAANHHSKEHPNSDAELVTKRPPTAYLARGLSIPRRPNLLHLLSGYPSNSRLFNWLSFAINLILICFCIDFQFTPLLGLAVYNTTFVRVGAFSDNSVKLVARLPPGLFPHRYSHTPIVNESLPAEITIVYRPTRDHGAWQYGGLFAPRQDRDYVGTIKLESLLPSTEYEYALVVPDHLDDKFVHPSINHPQYFKTAPDPKLALHQTHFTFAATSCLKPNWPYVPFESHFSVRGAADLADRISNDKIEFLV